MSTPSHAKSGWFTIDRLYLFQKLSEPPFHSLDHLQQSLDLLKMATKRYIESINAENRSPLQTRMFKELSSPASDKPLSLRTLKNHLIETQKGNRIGFFQEHTYLCIIYAAIQLQKEGVWSIDVDALKGTSMSPVHPSTGVDTLPSSDPRSSYPLIPNQDDTPFRNAVRRGGDIPFTTTEGKIPALNFDFYFMAPALSASMPSSQYPESVYERATLLGKIGIGVFFSGLASITLLLFYFLGANSGTLIGSFVTLSVMNYWTGRFGWFGDFQYHPQFTEIGRRFVYNMYLNSISPRQSFSFAVYSESLLVIVFIVLLTLLK